MDYRFPGWFKGFRPGQRELAERMAEELGRYRFVFLDAPTGVGKTVIAEAVRQQLAQRNPPTVMGVVTTPAGNTVGLSNTHRTRYLCTDKELQKQFINNFPAARLIQGRANYATLDYPFPMISADDCDLHRDDADEVVCTYCSTVPQCPYRIAKRNAVKAELAVLNTAYWVREVNGPGEFAGSSFLIVDECERMESAALGYIQVTIPKWVREECGTFEPQFKTKPSSWDLWAKGIVAPWVAQEVWRLSQLDSPNTRERKRLKRLDEIMDHLLRVSLEDGKWVMEEDGTGAVIFRPVWVSAYMKRWVWDRAGTKVMLMSATIISPDVRARDLGIPDGQWTCIGAPSPIDPRRRPVCIKPVADMSRKAQQASGGEEVGKLASGVVQIATLFPNDRILVHAVSYSLAANIARTLDMAFPGRVLSLTSTSEREAKLADFKTRAKAILVVPAMERGIDLPHDLCRVVIWAKVPFPSLSDKQVAARVYGGGRRGNEWYATETIASLVQGAGRAVRGESDWGITFVLDSQVIGLLNKWRGYWPKWFLDALDTTGGIAGMRGLEEVIGKTEQEQRGGAFHPG